MCARVFLLCCVLCVVSCLLFVVGCVLLFVLLFRLLCLCVVGVVVFVGCGYYYALSSS